MQSQAPSPAPDGRGLPPVLPPSGTHIFKMFVVPLLIVGGLLLGAFLFLRLTGGSVVRSPQGFLADLRSGNPDVRARAAQDLAQVLLRDDQLASDPHFGLDLAGDMPPALADADHDQAGSATPSDAATLQAGDNYLFYLSACVSHLSTPVGAPLLKQMALDGGPGSAKAQMTRRWRALWALANLGANLSRFDKLTPERQEAVLSGFEQEAAGEGDRATLAAATLACLKDRAAGKANSLGVDEVLVRCSADPNPFLREIAVFALNFWDGPGVEDALVARLDDRGEGEELLSDFAEGDKNREAHQFTKTPGLRIRYNAAVALARRGSNKTPVDLLGEMLDESQQLDQNRLRFRKDGRETADEATAYDVVNTALEAVAELHRKNANVNLTALDTAIDKLKDHSPNQAVRKEAERTRAALGK
jgi:hypothetical protein